MYCYQMPPAPCRPKLGTQRYKQPFSTDHVNAEEHRYMHKITKNSHIQHSMYLKSI